MPIKYEESEDTLANLSIKEEETPALHNDDENDDQNPQLPTPPSSPKPAAKKRRRSGGSVDHIAKIKSEDSTESTEQTPSARSKKEPKAKKQTSSAGAPKRGRPPGGSTAFTAEQDAYLIHLRQNSSNAEEIWVAFERKFHTGKNQKALCNRWFGIKDSVLLSGDDDKLLMETIEEVMGDVAASIVEKFKAKSGKKVTKGYVQKKMKEGKKAAKEEEGKAEVNVKEEV